MKLLTAWAVRLVLICYSWLAPVFILSKRRRRNFRTKIQAKSFSLLPHYSVPYTKPESTFKHFINIDGFGYSGKTALLDCLREFESCSVIQHDVEIGLLNAYGGIYYLEMAFSHKALNIRDFMLKQFITFTECLYLRGGIYNDEFKRLTDEFVNALVMMKIQTPTGLEGNHCFKFLKQNIKDYPNLQTPFLFENTKPRYRYILKDLSVGEYRALVQQYIISFFKTIPSQDFFISDALIFDGTYNADKLKLFIGEYKNILVYRDPRDIYVQTYNEKIAYIPSQVDDFIALYKTRLDADLILQPTSTLVVRYEDLVYRYDQVLAIVIDFIGLDQKDHKHIKKYFDPMVSSQDIGLWKAFPDQDAMNKIYTEFSAFCYEA